MRLFWVPTREVERFAAFMAPGVQEYGELADSTLALGGPRVDPKPYLASFLTGGFASLVVMILNEPIGYDIVSVDGEHLLGHQTWIAPEYRGQGHWRAYLAAISADARLLGCKEFRFTTTLKEWDNRAPKLGFRRIQWNTERGVTATTWGLEV